MTNTISLVVGGELAIRLLPPAADPLPVVTVWYRDFILTAKGIEMAFTLPVTHFVDVQVAYTDVHGNPATVDGDVGWTAEPAASVVLTPDTDTTRCRITPAGTAGNVQVTATADADLGEGVRALVTLLDVTLVAGEAVAGTIAPVGAPEPIPG